MQIFTLLLNKKGRTMALYGRDGEADEEIVKAPLKLKDRLQLIDQLDAINAHRQGDQLLENHCQKVYKDKYQRKTACANFRVL